MNDSDPTADELFLEALLERTGSGDADLEPRLDRALASIYRLEASRWASRRRG